MEDTVMNKPHHLFPICTSPACMKTQNARAGKALRRLTKRSQCMHWVLAILTVITSALAMPATASTVFADDTFDLTGYTIQTFQSGGASINTSQILTGGNPGAAVQALHTVPTHSSTFYISQYLMNSSFVYDPGTQGAIDTIDFLGDAYVLMSPGPLTASGIAAILSQGGDYYVHWVSIPIVNNSWQTGSQNGLLATDFNLVNNLLTGATDSTSHPDFTSGNIQFGLFLGEWTTGTVAQNWDLRLDNISYTVNAVPIPAAVWLFGSGLLALISIARRKETA